MTKGYIKFEVIGGAYQLVEDYQNQTIIMPDNDIGADLIELTTGGLLTIKKYYCSDGPSGPTIDTKSSLRGAFEHDAFFQLFRRGMLDHKWFDEVNNQLNVTCDEDGMNDTRSDMWEWSLNRFGDKAADPKNRREVLTAP